MAGMKPARSRRWDLTVLLVLAVLTVAGHDVRQASSAPDAPPRSPAGAISAPVGGIETLLPTRPNPGSASWVDLDPSSSGHAGGMAVLVSLATVLVLGSARIVWSTPGKPSSRLGGLRGFVRGPPLLVAT